MTRQPGGLIRTSYGAAVLVILRGQLRSDGFGTQINKEEVSDDV